MNLEHTTPELCAALAKAQEEIENASKGSVNPHFKSRYADLAEVLNTVRPVLAKHGISIAQSTAFDGAVVSVTTALLHSSGGYLTSTASCVPAKTDAQGIGSSTTYLRRYSLAAMTGVAQEDDDGQSAAHNAAPRKAKAPSPKVSPETLADIRTNLERLNVEEEAFTGYLKLQSLADATEDMLPRINSALAAKERKLIEA